MNRAKLGPPEPAVGRRQRLPHTALARQRLRQSAIRCSTSSMPRRCGSGPGDSHARQHGRVHGRGRGDERDVSVFSCVCGGRDVHAAERCQEGRARLRAVRGSGPRRGGPASLAALGWRSGQGTSRDRRMRGRALPAARDEPDWCGDDLVAGSLRNPERDSPAHRQIQRPDMDAGKRPCEFRGLDVQIDPSNCASLASSQITMAEMPH